MTDDTDAEFERTERIGQRINAVARAEEAVAESVPMPPEVEERLENLIDKLTSDDS